MGPDIYFTALPIGYSLVKLSWPDTDIFRRTFVWVRTLTKYMNRQWKGKCPPKGGFIERSDPLQGGVRYEIFHCLPIHTYIYLQVYLEWFAMPLHILWQHFKEYFNSSKNCDRILVMCNMEAYWVHGHLFTYLPMSEICKCTNTHTYAYLGNCCKHIARVGARARARHEAEAAQRVTET